MRGVLAGTAARTPLTNRADPLLLDAIVRYMALSHTWNEGLLSHTQTLYDLAARYKSHLEYRESFANLNSSYVTRDYALSTKGVLVVEGLQRDLAASSSSLNSLMRDYLTSPVPSLQIQLATHLGIRYVHRLYSQILNSDSAGISGEESVLSLTRDFTCRRSATLATFNSDYGLYAR